MPHPGINSVQSSPVISQWLSLGLGIDDTLMAQTCVWEMLAVKPNFRQWEESLRLWADHQALNTFTEALAQLRKTYPEQPWLTFIGSGDFHHLTHTLLETLAIPNERPLHLILIDNHPDWFQWGPKYHCGNWVSLVLKQKHANTQRPKIASVHLLGQDSEDFSPTSFCFMPFDDLAQGRVNLYPYQKKRLPVLGRWPVKVAGVKHSVKRWYGVDLHPRTVSETGIQALCEELLQQYPDDLFYISIDKDCLHLETSTTDWDQGSMHPNELLDALRVFKASHRLIGVDVCGELSQKPVQGLWKNIDSGRYFRHSPPSEVQIAQNQSVNQAILEIFSGTNPL
ncbi:MAG: hypothetical protein K2X01_03440 [Cyanobacteria bacterium]|nr:hypothetical protein [Cyanobacteriota bacterium]